MSVTIYKYGQENIPRCAVEGDTSSQQSVTLMAEDTLTLSFKVTNKISFQIGDYCYWFGKLYQINTLPKITETANNDITYNLVMESEMYDLGKVQFLFLDANNQFTQSAFTFRGTPQNYGDLLIYNLLRVFPDADWILGSVISADLVTQDFTGQNCLEALQTIATIFNTEYLVEGKTINIFQRATSSGLILSRGQGKALVNLTVENQDNSNIITRLYVFGSTRNITNTYRDASPNLRIGDINYIEKNVDLYKIFEQTIFFDGTTKDKNGAPLPEIYPHRTGVVSAVDGQIGTSDQFVFYDDSIDFDLNDCLISGVTAQVVFNTGLLAGYTFDIGAYDDTTKKITINQNTNEPNLIVPTSTLIMAIGDEYVFVSINMPQSYIDQAEADLRTAGIDYLDEFCIPSLAYSGDCNQIYFKSKNVPFLLAQTVGIASDVLGINATSRITSYTRNIRNPYLYTLKLADTVKPTSLLVQIINGL